MAKGKVFTFDDLKNKGIVEVSPGVFQKTSFPQPRDIKKQLVKISTLELDKLIEENHDVIVQNKSILTIDGIISGLNGDKGLMRAHWSETKRMKNIYAEIIRIDILNKKVHSHPGKVKIRYIGYKSHLMDWDNFCSSFKHIGDALVEARVIVDDKPSIVIQFLPEQIKCKRVDQKVIIIIEDTE